MPCSPRDAPVDLVIETVEAVWERIAEADDWTPLNTLIGDIRDMGSAYGLGEGPCRVSDGPLTRPTPHPALRATLSRKGRRCPRRGG